MLCMVWYGMVWYGMYVYVFVMLATNHFGTGHHHWYVSNNLGFPKSLSHRSWKILQEIYLSNDGGCIWSSGQQMVRGFQSVRQPR